MRAETIERFAEFLGIRDRVEETGVESYAHRTLLAYIGGRIWLDHPVTGVGWQASSEQWAYGPYLDDARERFPNEPDQAFPAPEHPWGIQLLYLQVAADLGIAGRRAPRRLRRRGDRSGHPRAPLGSGRARRARLARRRDRRLGRDRARLGPAARGADLARGRAGDRP